MKRFPTFNPALVRRYNQRYCRIAASRPGHKARHAKFQPRTRDIDLWRMLGGSSRTLSFATRSHGPGPIDALKHALPFHLFPLSDRIEATRLRAKGVIL